MDIQAKVYEAIAASSKLQDVVRADRVKFYEFPPSGAAASGAPYIVIDPLDAQAPAVFADDTWIAESQLLQVEVWGGKRREVFVLAEALRAALATTGLLQKPGGVDEYDAETKVYRDARRYDGALETI